jgi:hypothetical protein
MSALADTAPRSLPLTRAVELTAIALCLAQISFLAVCFVQGHWLVGPDGAVVPNDFINVWAAGRQALHHDVAAAYDHGLHKFAEDAAAGFRFAGEYPWNYPPHLLFVAVPLALVPLNLAALVWLAATFPLYLAAMRGILGGRSALLLACAFPGILANLLAVQNGFLTAALVGGALALLERRQVAAGVLLGLLTFKPHFGLLIPFALVAGGYWRAVVAAGATFVALAIGSSVVFGLASWIAFVHALPATSQATLAHGSADFAKMQSLYAVVRLMGGNEALAWSLHGTLACLCAAAVAVVWRMRMDYALKAATLSAAALLATPYLFMYDLVVLAVPMAFLLRHARARGVGGAALVRLAPVCLLLLSFAAVQLPVGFAAVVLVAVQIAATACTSISAASSTRRSIISSVFGG